MRYTRNSKTTWALITACWGVAGLGVLGSTGCNKMESPVRQADRNVDENLGKSVADRDLPGDKSSKAVYDDLTKASTESGASSAAKVRAKSELAREELARAIAQFPELDRRSLQIEQAIWDLRQAVAQVANTQQVSAAYAKAEPKEPLARSEEDRGMIQMSIAKAKAEEQAAQAEVDKRKEEIEALKADRTKADTEAQALMDKSADAKGEESVNLFAQATEARTKSGTLAAQIEVKSAGLVLRVKKMVDGKEVEQEAPGPLVAAVDRAKKQGEIWEASLKDNEAFKQQIDARWQATQADVVAMTDTAKKITAGSIAPGKGAASANAGERLARLIKGYDEESTADKKGGHVQGNDEQRAAVAKLLNDSIKHSMEAVAAAKSLRSELAGKISGAKDPTAVDAKSWKSLLSLYDENQYILQQGAAENALGDLYAGEGALQSQLASLYDDQTVDKDGKKTTTLGLKNILKASGIEVPSDLPAADPVQARQDAAKAYKAAETTLGPVVDVTLSVEDIQIVKNAALVGLMHAQFARYQLTHEKEAADAFKVDQIKAKEAQIELPGTLRQTLE